MTKVKICGIQDIQTAQIACNAGADYLGFVFAKSKRRISPDLAREIISSLPSNILKVGVFVDKNIDDVIAIADFCGLDIIQLHGSEKHEEYRLSPYPIIKSVSVKNDNTDINNSIPNADFILFDTWNKDMAGGCGKCFDWNYLDSYSYSTPFFLAGGLEPNNVCDAIKRIKPYAVDVSSGVETNGIKDHTKIVAFINKVKECSTNEL